MKRCLACEAIFETAGWPCPKCGYQPALGNEIYQFTEKPPDAYAGFKPEYFVRLADIEESNFWFCARNELIQWALRNYFPDAKSFFEVGCGTGFVLAGIHEKFARMRLAGSEIFADGLAIAKARLPNVELYQMDARRISFEREFDAVGAFDVLEHVIEDENVLAQMFNAVRFGGGLLALCHNILFFGARATIMRCINAATTAPNCAQKSRALVSKSSESLLLTRCCYPL